MKLLYWLDEWLTLCRDEQQTKLPMCGGDLLGDVYVKYDFVDLNKSLLFTFSPAGTNVQEHDLTDDFAPWGYHLAQKQNVNVISFQHLGKSNWFRSRNLIFFLEQLSSLLTPFKCRLGYGLSRGGFAVGAFASTATPASDAIPLKVLVTNSSDVELVAGLPEISTIFCTE